MEMIADTESMVSLEVSRSIPFSTNTSHRLLGVELVLSGRGVSNS